MGRVRRSIANPRRKRGAAPTRKSKIRMPRATRGRRPKPYMKMNVRKAPGGLPTTLADYTQLCRLPFEPTLWGAKQPSEFPIQTVAHHMVLRMQLAAVGTNFSFTVHAHPAFSFTAPVASTAVSGGVALNSLVNLPTTMQVWGSTTEAALATLYESYRVVTTGVRIKPQSNFTSTAGTLDFALVPAQAIFPNRNATGTAIADIYNEIGLPFDGTNISSSIVNYPMSGNVSAGQMLESGGIEITLPPVNELSATYLNPTQAWRGDSLALVGTPVTGEYTDPTFSSTAGWTTLAVVGSGMNTGESFMVEVIYHIEGTPRVIQNNPIPQASMPMSAGENANDISIARRAVSHQSFLKTVSDSMHMAAKAVTSRTGKSLGRMALGALTGNTGQMAKGALGLSAALNW